MKIFMFNFFKPKNTEGEKTQLVGENPPVLGKVFDKVLASVKNDEWEASYNPKKSVSYIWTCKNFPLKMLSDSSFPSYLKIEGFEDFRFEPHQNLILCQILSDKRFVRSQAALEKEQLRAEEEILKLLG